MADTGKLLDELETQVSGLLQQIQQDSKGVPSPGVNSQGQGQQLKDLISTLRQTLLGRETADSISTKPSSPSLCDTRPLSSKPVDDIPHNALQASEKFPELEERIDGGQEEAECSSDVDMPSDGGDRKVHLAERVELKMGGQKHNVDHTTTHMELVHLPAQSPHGNSQVSTQKAAKDKERSKKGAKKPTGPKESIAISPAKAVKEDNEHVVRVTRTGRKVKPPKCWPDPVSSPGKSNHLSKPGSLDTLQDPLKVKTEAVTSLMEFKCFACDENFPNVTHYKKHCQRSGEKCFHCSICDVKWSKYQLYSEHMRTHAGQVSFAHDSSPGEELRGDGPNEGTGVGDGPSTSHLTDEERNFKRGDESTLDKTPAYNTRQLGIRKPSRSPRKLLKLNSKIVGDDEHPGNEVIVKAASKGRKLRMPECLPTRQELPKTRNPHRKSTSTAESGTRHHTPGTVYKCYKCEADFATLQEYEDHCQLQVEKCLHCHLCDETYTSYQTYSEHMVLHFEEKSHQCPVCGDVHTNKSTLVRHLKTHSDREKRAPLRRKIGQCVGECICYVCEDKFDSLQDYKAHYFKRCAESDISEVKNYKRIRIKGEVLGGNNQEHMDSEQCDAVHSDVDMGCIEGDPETNVIDDLIVMVAPESKHSTVVADRRRSSTKVINAINHGTPLERERKSMGQAKMSKEIDQSSPRSVMKRTGRGQESNLKVSLKCTEKKTGCRKSSTVTGGGDLKAVPVGRRNKVTGACSVFKCYPCVATFTTLAKYKKHCLHEGEKFLHCPLCDEEWDEYQSYSSHMMNHIGEESFTCPNCHKSFAANASLRDHMKRNKDASGDLSCRVNPMLYKCYNCLEEFVTMDDYREHCKLMGEEFYRCTLCNISHSHYVPFREHMGLHTGEAPFSCPNCRRCYRNISSLIAHSERYKSNHEGVCELNDMVYRCYNCKVEFTTFDGYSQHCQLNEEVFFYCQVCDRTYNNYLDYSEHMMHHFGVKPFCCPICGTAFADETSLLRHFTSHSQQDAVYPTTNSRKENSIYFCFICGEKFETLSNYSMHYSWKCKNVFEHKTAELQDCQKGNLIKLTSSVDVKIEASSDSMGYAQLGLETPDVAMDVAEPGIDVADGAEEDGIDRAIQNSSLCGDKLILKKGNTYDENTEHLTDDDYHTEEQSIVSVRKKGRRKLLPMASDIGVAKFVCLVCGEGFPTMMLLNSHTSLHAEVLLCPICAEHSSGSAERTAHMTEHVEDEYRCRACADVVLLDSFEALNEHSHQHAAVTLFACCSCEKTFSLPRDLAQHFSAHHYEEPQAGCVKSSPKSNHSKVDAKPYAMEEGRKLRKLRRGPYKCYNCAKTFKTFKKYKIHCRLMKEPLFCCIACDISCSDYASYEEHMETHFGDLTFLCPSCGKCFQSERELDEHAELHVVGAQERAKNVFPYKCYDCAFDLDSLEKYTDHCREAHKGRMFYCSLCCKTLQPGVYRQHMRLHLGDKPHKCSQCGKTFIVKGHLIRHQKTHTKEGCYMCSVCGVTRSLRVQFEKHMASHTNVWPYACDKCGKGCPDKASYTIHLEEHRGGWKHKCKHCKKSLQKSHLQLHERRCPIGNPLTCEVCGASFTAKSSFTYHMHRKHNRRTGPSKLGLARSFPCVECDQSFYAPGALKRHRLTHSGFKPHPCPKCGRGFADKACMLNHVALHDNPKPFPCSLCYKSFTKSYALVLHQRSEHPYGPGVNMGRKNKPPTPAKPKKPKAESPGLFAQIATEDEAYHYPDSEQSMEEALAQDVTAEETFGLAPGATLENDTIDIMVNSNQMDMMAAEQIIETSLATGQLQEALQGVEGEVMYVVMDGNVVQLVVPSDMQTVV